MPGPDRYDAIPKVELHCHLEGTVRPTTVVDLARKRGAPLPTDDPTELYRYTSLDSFLEIFWLVQSLIGDRDDWARVARESVGDAALHGLRYREAFFTPARHLAAGQALADIIAGLTDGLDQAERETGIRCALICDIDRSFGPAAAVELVDALVGLSRNGAAERVIGIGMDSTERGINPAAFAPAYQAAGRAGLRLTGHAGEDTGPENIRAALDALGLERVDHGIAVVEDDELMARVAQARVPFNVCPSSNVVIANRYRSVAEHPMRRMRDAGLLVTINTDDPAMTGADLGSEYRVVAEELGFSFGEMCAMATEAIDATWLDAGEKAVLRRSFEDGIARIGHAGP